MPKKVDIDCKIDPEDQDLLINFRWHYRQTQGQTYISRWNPYPRYDYLHRVILSRVFKSPLPKNLVVDHINGDPLDNRRSNLRLVPHAINCMNSKNRKNKSGLRGVAKKRWGYEAHISINNKLHYLGTFKTADEASEAYKTARKERLENAGYTEGTRYNQ